MSSAKLVKELRELSGAGMMDCKRALDESSGDLEKAMEGLRKSGIAKAQKKEGRTAKEGLILSHINANSGVLLEINCETDFVANTNDFVELGENILKHIVETKSTKLEDVLEENFIKDSNKKVKDVLTETIGKLGENIVLSRFCKFKLESSGLMASYIHPGSKLGVLLEINSEVNSSEIDNLKPQAKDIAMHIAASSPISVNIEDVPSSILDKEKEIYFDQAKNSGKPDNIIEKMIDGRIVKFYKENVLMEQQFVKDPDKTIKDIIAENTAKTGESVVIKRFSRFQLGETVKPS